MGRNSSEQADLNPPSTLVQHIMLYIQQGKSVWSVDDKLISCLAASESRQEVVLGQLDGFLQFWSMGEWIIKGKLHASSGVCKLMYGSIKNSSLPNTFLLVS